MIIWIRIGTLDTYNKDGRDFWLKRRLEDISGQPCLMLHQEQMTPEIVGPLKPRAMLLSGCGTFFQHFKPETFYGFEDTLNAMADVPTLGLCASHQLMGFMFNSGFRNLTKLEDEMMRPLRPGEPDVLAPNPDAAGFFSEEGFYPVSVLRPDPLFDALPDTIVVRQSHYAEMKILPPEFDLIASNENCRIQAIKHRSRPLYGTQFHPEYYVDVYPHGLKILENFFRFATVL